MTVIDCAPPALEIHITPPARPPSAVGASQPARPPLVFVHGAFAGAWCWEEYFAPYFSRMGYTTVTFSLRGHGNSEGWDLLDLASLGDYVDDLTRVVAGLDQPPVLIGHSMGGMVVQKYLETRSAAAMVLMASVGPWGLLESSWHMMLSSPGLMQGISLMQMMGKPVLSADVFYDGLFSSAVPPARAARFLQLFQRESQRVILDLSLWDVPRQPPRTPLPTLVMGAGDDAFIPRSMVQRTARYLDAEHLIVPDMSHAMMLEETWRQAADPVLHWLRGQGL
ncbi:alpha/beta hydrolase [Roseospira marina]|uniref:Alpha/beta hydrolase n=1 Tax=Roseospira marina TaxID=140057 RepID=A0A5M6IET0_9PROT|nr:alpha/beta hydrolase [Roseospira marina]KAA5606786.1 alpha/beta hydrolase [Roseospira marina]MBB4313792.1 pimeloyl-ACP methyl ester carboxylesterase [Roseospira marina]MBB5086954.1 pimeloyl-ACP methyl ester carboxylesterase [Roseospira marina]